MPPADPFSTTTILTRLRYLIAPPLQRVIFLFLGLSNVRKATWFTRDPKRLFP
jgi:hypothetical protein